MSRRRPRCTECGSRSWSRLPAGGYVCEEGHLRQGIRDEIADVDEGKAYAGAVSHSQRRTKRVKHVDERRRLNKAERRYVLLQAMQTILRHQTAALIAGWNLPAVFEDIVRDIWAIVVDSHLVMPDEFWSDRQAAELVIGQPTLPHLSLNEHLSDLASDSELESSSTDELSDHSSSREAGQAPSNNQSADKASLVPLKPSQLLIILYLACQFLRVPCFFADLLRLAKTEQIPWNSALGLLPEAILRDLPTIYQARYLADTRSIELHLLHPNKACYARPTRDLISDTTLIAQQMAAKSIDLPPINMPPLLRRLVEHLALPPIAYQIVKQLIARLDLPLVWDTSELQRRHTNPSELQSESGAGRPGLRWHLVFGLSAAQSLVRCPDVLLAALVVSAAKVIYGLDGQVRLHDLEGGRDLLALPSHSRWISALRKLDRLPSRHAIDALWQKDITELSDGEIDAYVAFCDIHLGNRQSGSRIRNGATRLFEEDHASGSAHTVQRHLEASEKRLGDIASDLYAGETAPPTGAALPRGSIRTHNHRREEPVHADLELVCKRVGGLIGTETGEMVEVVAMVECGLGPDLVQEEQSERLRGKFNLNRTTGTGGTA
ncbi:hypothetical protein E5Q_05764 [Mixia osmundae IAM 14324]|uniref:RRN7-type domain-containing protein n=1 Tax=Mixia osmundae (strain CBS 9802 / IAM 14324 / JCM 22182 / KY 12970) TaxID=764103 RepID=G7E8B5_MIXOS|nr:hypothetical protein E5Q_05764 [Mixia osmundae IAM 14324]